MNVSVKTDEQLRLELKPTLLNRMRRGELLVEACPSREVLKHITSRWGVLVLLVLETRVHRFSELRRAIGGVSERMLAQTLQAAEKVRELADWIEDSLPRILQAQDSRSQERASAKSSLVSRATPAHRSL